MDIELQWVDLEYVFEIILCGVTFCLSDVLCEALYITVDPYMR